MINLKDKEPLFSIGGFTAYRPDTTESVIIVGAIMVILMGLNHKFEAPLAWGLIGFISMSVAVFDLVPPQKPLRTFLVGVAAGAAIASISLLAGS